MDAGRQIGTVAIAAAIPLDIAREKVNIWTSWTEWQKVYDDWKDVRSFLHSADGADHGIRALRGRLDRPVRRQADQRTHRRPSRRGATR